MLKMSLPNVTIEAVPDGADWMVSFVPDPKINPKPCVKPFHYGAWEFGNLKRQCEAYMGHPAEEQ